MKNIHCSFHSLSLSLSLSLLVAKQIASCREQVGGLFERVKETVAERILVKSWLDEETRTQALLKLNSLRGRFHVWPGFYNESLLAREMAEVRAFLVLLCMRRPRNTSIRDSCRLCRFR